MGWENYCAFDVQGEPKGQPRPRAFVRGKRAAVYDPGTAEGWKGQIALAAREFLPCVPLSGPIMLSVCFFFPRPQRLLRKSSPSGRIPHTAKPDIDNAIKAVMDCLTGIRMWEDDAQVVSTKAEKTYAAKEQRPGALIQVFTFKEA
jgi:Holliday junction resolvase RusA-like endonuclease